MVRPLRMWQKSSIGSVAMGHEIGVTALQLAQACTVIASGGFLLKPRLRMDAPKVDPGSRAAARNRHHHAQHDGRRGHQALWNRASDTRGCWAIRRRAKPARRRFTTTSIRQYTHLYNASFMGFAPVTNPRIVIVVTINGTEGTVGYGGPTSAPVFREVAAAGLRVMDVPKDLPEMVPSDGSDQADENDVAIADLGSSIPPPLVQAGDAVAADDRPVASANSALDQRVFLAAGGSSERDLAGPRVPNFQGKTVRNVIRAGSRAGHSGGVHRQRNRARAGSRGRAPSCLRDAGFACNLAASEAP